LAAQPILGKLASLLTVLLSHNSENGSSNLLALPSRRVGLLQFSGLAGKDDVAAKTAAPQIRITKRGTLLRALSTEQAPDGFRSFLAVPPSAADGYGQGIVSTIAGEK